MFHKFNLYRIYLVLMYKKNSTFSHLALYLMSWLFKCKIWIWNIYSILNRKKTRPYSVVEYSGKLENVFIQQLFIFKTNSVRVTCSDVRILTAIHHKRLKSCSVIKKLLYVCNYLVSECIIPTLDPENLFSFWKIIWSAREICNAMP